VSTTQTRRFLSCEPLLGPVGLRYSAFNGSDSFGSMEGIHWVICGGESAERKRPCENCRGEGYLPLPKYKSSGYPMR